MKTLTPAERLIVPLDFTPNPSDRASEPHYDVFSAYPGQGWAWEKVIEFAEKLTDTGVCLKLNSALRACGYGLIRDVHQLGLKVFADLKLYDIQNTLRTDGVYLREAKPEMLTVVCSAGASAMRSLKDQLPDTEVLGVTVLTSIGEEEASQTYGMSSLLDAVLMFAKKADNAGLDGIISSAKEASAIRSIISPRMTINTPAIRPEWYISKFDDQNPDRINTPAEAIKAGADRIIIGRPILEAKDPYEAVMRTLDEIASVTV